MDPKAAKQPVSIEPLELPEAVVGLTDINRLQRELESLEEFLQQARIRQPGTPLSHVPRTSPLFEEFGVANKLNWLDENDRTRAARYFETIKKDAPLIHISFAANPSAAFIGKLIVWFRHNIHPQLLIQIGLQPTIAAGCVVRTPNHVFDFSLRRRFTDSKQLLIDSLKVPK